MNIHVSYKGVSIAVDELPNYIDSQSLKDRINFLFCIIDERVKDEQRAIEPSLTIDGDTIRLALNRNRQDDNGYR